MANRSSLEQPATLRQQRKTIESTAQSVPIVLASNFSVGVNVLFWLTQKAAEFLGADFNPEIVETHHTKKKDAPSGTAKTLGEILKTMRNSEIPIQSIREGDVVGEHTVNFRRTRRILGANASRSRSRNFCRRRIARSEVDYQQTAGTVLDAECAGAIIGLSFRAQSRNPVAPPLRLIAGCLDFARHDGSENENRRRTRLEYWRPT